jgi:hypothetical protein
VKVVVQRHDSQVETVSDNGQGISPDFAQRFDRFQQDGSMTRRHGGLVLRSVHRQKSVEMHGGLCEKAKGRRARFYRRAAHSAARQQRPGVNHQNNAAVSESS